MASDANQPANLGPAPTAKMKARPAKPKPKRKKLRPYNVILLDDDEHSYEYVIEMLGVLFSHATERAYQMAKEVDETGRVIVLTTHRERAELKRDQIMGYGADPRIEACRGSMRATIEPARSAD